MGGAAEVAESVGRGGLRRLVLTAADGARAEVYRHGAHVTSWVPAGGDERLFVSAHSEFRAGAAIRGGVPVIFPQFGPGALPRHGFARTADWEVVDAGVGEGGTARARLLLRDDAATRAVWPAAFTAELTVEVGGPSLAISLGVHNRGARPLAFTAALHSYLRVSDLAAAAVEGLRGARYRDQAAGGREAVDDAPALGF
ncbi:MAG: Aldose 1-epimerase, partial [uncultured Gemmatimonadaceae bacterium]